VPLSLVRSSPWGQSTFTAATAHPTLLDSACTHAWPCPDSFLLLLFPPNYPPPVQSPTSSPAPAPAPASHPSPLLLSPFSPRQQLHSTTLDVRSLDFFLFLFLLWVYHFLRSLSIFDFTQITFDLYLRLPFCFILEHTPSDHPFQSTQRPPDRIFRRELVWTLQQPRDETPPRFLPAHSISPFSLLSYKPSRTSGLSLHFNRILRPTIRAR